MFLQPAVAALMEMSKTRSSNKNNMIISSMALVLVFVTFIPGSTSSVSMRLDTDSSTISCLADKLDRSALKINGIQLISNEKSLTVKMDEESMVSIDENPNRFKIKADGKIENELWKSYLTIKISGRPKGHSGTYTCKIYYTDPNGINKNNVISDQLNITDQGHMNLFENVRSKVWILQKELRGLKAKDRLQEKTIKSQSQEIKDLQENMKNQSQAIKVLQQEGKNQSQAVKNLQEDGDFRNLVIEDLQEKGQACVFTAYYNASNKFKSGVVLLFSNVELNLGNGYNGTTGVFTAPKAGVYSFSLTITTESSGDEAWVYIYHNGNSKGKVYANDYKSSGDQSSKTVTIKLSKGDKVYNVIYSTTNVLEDYEHYSLFSGNLVQAL